jgi:dTDP-4-dehydrorhamnose reductase
MILILGAKGMLGGQLMEVFGNDAIGWDRQEVDVTDFENLKLKVERLKPKAVINCVAYNDVDGAEEKKELAFKLNAEAAGNVAKLCKTLDIPFIHYSTNYIFDGVKGEYEETDKPNPLSQYAKSKYAGEVEVEKNCEKFYIIRTAVLFGPKGQSEASKKSFIDVMVELSKSKPEIKVVNDEIVSVTYAPDLARATQVLLSQQFAYGIYHFTNLGQASWYDLAKQAFTILNKSTNLIPVSASEFPRKAIRPKKAVLLNTKFIEFRPWQEALKEFLTAS